MDHERNEYELALRARDGDREALAELVERTRLRLFALAYAELRHYDDAQDAVASALLQVCLHVGELREPEKIRAWMQRIVRNEAHRLRRGPDAAMVRLEGEEWPAGFAEPSLLLLDIERALRRLPGSQAEVLRLFYLEELSMDDIARRLGRSTGTIGSWLHRGRRHLANAMEEYALMRPTRPKAAPPAPPSRSAAILHTDLEPALLEALVAAFQADGCRTQIFVHDESAGLPEALAEAQCIVLDEWIAGRPALEILLNLRAQPETKETPVCVLWDKELPQVARSAYWMAGLDKLIWKEDRQDLPALPASVRGLARRVRIWHRHSNRARRVIALAEAEAGRLGTAAVGPEHLLLALLAASREEPVTLAGRILVERLGISLESIQEAIEKRVTRGNGEREQSAQLTQEAQRVLYLVWCEARELGDNYIGTEHYLLGLIHEEVSSPAQVLVDLGADLERTRRAIQAMREAASG